MRRSLPNVRAAFITARSMHRRDGAWWVDAGVGRIIDELATRVQSLTAAMSEAPTAIGLQDHRLALSDERVRPLPFLPGVVQGLRLGAPCRRVLGPLERDTQVSVVQLPFAAPLGLLPPRRRVYHVCADVAEIVRSSPSYAGVKAIPARSLAIGIDRFEAGLIRWPGARFVSNGEELLEHFGRDRGRAVVSASLFDREIDSVKRERSDGAFRVLFVGYLRREKGVDALMEACERLAARAPRPLELSIVGAKDTSDRGATDAIRAALERLRAKIKVSFEGSKAFGPELFRCFADADVLALPSLSEGTPRVLVEARAFRCAVVATRVGGVPTSVTDGIDGLLVPPSDPSALEQALERLMTDEPLRQRLIDAGLHRAHATTVEAMVDSMVEQMERALEA